MISWIVRRLLARVWISAAGLAGSYASSTAWSGAMTVSAVSEPNAVLVSDSSVYI